jgi:hypothetical protein
VMSRHLCFGIVNDVLAAGRAVTNNDALIISSPSVKLVDFGLALLWFLFVDSGREEGRKMLTTSVDINSPLRGSLDDTTRDRVDLEPI